MKINRNYVLGLSIIAILMSALLWLSNATDFGSTLATTVKPISSHSISLSNAEALSEQDSQINFELLVEETIQCAALIAITESTLKGEIKAGSPAFTQIGDTLGQAKLYAANGKLDSTLVSSRYQLLTIQYMQKFQQNQNEAVLETREKYNLCIENAKSYNPDQKIRRMIKEAQNMAKSEDSQHDNANIE